MISSKNSGFGNTLYLQIPRIKQPFPLFVIFRALGIITDKAICQKILLDVNHSSNSALLSLLQASIIDANNYLTQESAFNYIMSQVIFTPLNMDKET